MKKDYDLSGIDGVVFDFGGVISVSPMPKWPRTLFPYCAKLGLSGEQVLAGFKKYRHDWDGDDITFEEMYRRIFADAGLAAPTDAELAEISRLDKCSWVDVLRGDTLEYMREVKATGRKIGILSNMSSDFFRDCYEPKCAAYRALADVEVISGFERVCKPDPRIYGIAAERMGMPPSRLVFFDDFMENVEGARALGWHAELYPAVDAEI